MSKRYLLKGGTVVDPWTSARADVRIDGKRVIEIREDLRAKDNEIVLECTGYYVCPGLVNAHDHLPFNLFPRLGTPPYANSYEWGRDIHARLKAAIEPITSVPLRDRLFWGAWKNLFSGVTSVVHHDPYYAAFRLGFPVHVLKRYTWAHSLGFEADMEAALRRRRKGMPFIMHVAEGVDAQAMSEVGRLHKMGGLDDRTVAVHGVGIQENDVDIMASTRTSLIWCPASNCFLFDRTAPVALLKGKVRMALGTDSTLTGSVSLFEEMRIAHRSNAFSPEELFSMVTEAPREIFAFPRDVGSLCEGGRADLFLLRRTEANPFQSLLTAEPGDIDALFRGGVLRFFDEQFDAQLGGDSADTSVILNGRTKRVLSPTFAGRFARIRSFLGHYSFLRVV